jgi:phytoene dehydrogenase-like protein
MPDAVVIGAGPNGLVAANNLVDRGWSVTVLEAAGTPGGAVRSGELTLPGFRHDLFSAFYPLAVSSPALTSLRLEQFGLRWRRAPIALAHPLLDGRCASLSTDLEATAESADAFARGDGAAWIRMIEQWDRIAEPFLSALLGPFPPLRSTALLARRLGRRGALRLARHCLLPVRRMTEELFHGEGAGLLLGGSALHADVCPEAAGSGLYGWLLACLGQRHGFPVPEGGAGALTDALVGRLISRGGKVVCGSRVTRVVVRGGRAVAVETASGAVVDAAKAVLADVAAPTLFRQLVGEEHLPAPFMADLQRFHWDESTVKVDWALARPVPWRAIEAAQAGTVHIADDFNNLTEFSAQLAMGHLPSRPFLLFGQQSRADPSRSPPGTETAWAYTHVPRVIRGDAAGEINVSALTGQRNWLPALVDRIEARVERLAPGFREAVIGRHVFGPEDLQSEDANLHLGAIGGGTAQLHQQLIFRPVPGAGRAETPIANLYLASASAHPGGGVHGAAGANAARAAYLGMRKSRANLAGRARIRAPA